LLRIGNYCKICSTDELRRKFPTTKALKEHHENYHRKAMCDKCLEFKPVLLFDQKLFDFNEINFHVRKNHPHCYFCHHLCYYDQDQLNRHYIQDHNFCDICKKQGKKRVMEKGKFTNLPEYEVYRNYEELVEHFKKKHFTCD
jgi:hypothetical protein